MICPIFKITKNTRSAHTHTRTYGAQVIDGRSMDPPYGPPMDPLWVLLWTPYGPPMGPLVVVVVVVVVVIEDSQKMMRQQRCG